MKILARAFAALVLLCLAASPAFAQYTHNGNRVPAWDWTLDKLRVTGDTLIAGATFNTPAGTTAYSDGDLIANSGTAGSVAPMQFTVCRVAGGSGMIRRVRIKTTETGQAGKIIVLKLYRTIPTPSNGDNGAWLTNEADYVGQVAVTLDQHFTDFEKGIGSPSAGSEINFDCNAGSTVLYGLMVESGASATLGGAKAYTAVVEALVN